MNAKNRFCEYQRLQIPARRSRHRHDLACGLVLARGFALLVRQNLGLNLVDPEAAKND